MRKVLTILGLAVCTPALFARDTALLRNGFSISHDHRQQIGVTTRLFLSASEEQYVDVLTENIADIQKDEPAAPAAAPEPAISVSSTSTAPIANAADIDSLVEKAARENQLDSDFIRAVIRTESGGNAHALSAKGAQGLMQLMPRTAQGLGVHNSFDAGENIGAGTSYLRSLLARYHNDPIRALAAYNAGALRVQQYGGVPPYHETRAYVARVMRDYNRRKVAQGKSAAKSKKTAPLSAASHPPSGD
ncbi:MAG: lytic transglycosylase domain-containing protein [Acidobacteria bacterium]|nr:lytic transglycosylase domain-containing protein [Acidobacteriota bacterium]